MGNNATATFELENEGSENTAIDVSTGFSSGVPVNDSTMWESPQDMSPDELDNMGDEFKKGELVTLYTANYLRWYYTNQPKMEEKSRIEVAKAAIKSVINTTESVDFGLEIFNLNYPNKNWGPDEVRNGGRIIAGIKKRSESEKNDFLNTIENLPAETNTPLCETLYEAYRYFSGQSVYYGDDDSDYNGWSLKYDGNRPPRDTSIENNGAYQSPFNRCSDIAYIVYISDGEPTQDANANVAVQDILSAKNNTTLENYSSLTDAEKNELEDLGEYGSFEYESSNNGKQYSWLPALASYMYWHDQVSTNDSFQHVRTYTIGFALEDGSAAEPLLAETARRGRGEYFSASSTGTNSSASLAAVFSKVLSEITHEGQRFSAPGVAYSNADPTRTLDSAYYALFEPSSGPRWTGNLKKFKVNSSGVLVDASGKNAIGISGGIRDSACSFWSSCSPQADGNKVELGGAARKIDPDNRTIYTDIASGDGLVSLASIFSGSEADATKAALGVSTSEQLAQALEWLKGNNVDKDSDGTLMSDDFDGVRGDIMGDPMHSQPLAIDYGDGLGTFIFVGTNSGMFHAFKDEGDSVSEAWAMMPKQFLDNVATLRANNFSVGHSVYGIDGSPVSYIERDPDGKITTAWLFFGLRRGGTDYFALDVTNPNLPKLKWHINSNNTDFSELGQTWSTPVVTKVPTVAKGQLAVIFGGGYDASYDTGTPSAPVGRNVFVVDADNGHLLYNFGDKGNKALTGIEDSVPGSIATLDSDGDGITDRLYAADLGGNVWRMDMPSTDKNDWSAFKFAALGGATDANNRKFFYEPVVAQTEFTNITTVTYTDADGNSSSTTGYQNVPYDAVTLGSGNRAAPLALGTQNMFYVLQDRNVITKSFNSAVPSAITVDNLYDVTTGAPETDAENLAFGTKLGWHFNFPGLGEKSLSPATIIKGKVYFTSFTPSLDNPTNICQLSSNGQLRSFDLHKGGRYNYEYLDVCSNCIPQPPKIVTPPDDPENVDGPDAVLIIGSGECVGEECSGTVKLESGLTTNKIYYHVNED